ncbi:hypothetical protein L1887_27613 [Cichorium endivia]|nr:hypothetical protein L1887_27613 [Cichorium endivia]
MLAILLLSTTLLLSATPIGNRNRRFTKSLFAYGHSKSQSQTNKSYISLISLLLIRSLSLKLNRHLATLHQAMKPTILEPTQCSSISPQANVEMSSPSFRLIGSNGARLGSQVSSPTQLQGRNKSHSDDRQKCFILLTRSL